MSRLVLFPALLLLMHLCPAICDASPLRETPFPPGFGRFGRDNDDGLLTLNVSPSGFSAPPEVNALHVLFGDGTARAKVTALDPTHKTLALTGGGPGAPVRLDETLLAPGFTATYGKRLTLTFSGEKAATYRARIVRLPSTPSRRCAVLLVHRTDRPGILVALAFRPGLSVRPLIPLLQPHDLSIQIVSPAEIGAVRFLTPMGLKEMPVDARESDLVRVVNETAILFESAIPLRRTSTYRLTPDRQWVVITETFHSDFGPTYAPLPPLLLFAWQHGYPVRIDRAPLPPLLDRTKHGPYTVIRGNRLRYTLPIPPTEEHGYLRDPRSSDPFTVEQINALVGHLGGDWAENAVDLGYAGMTNAQMAGAYLSPANRQAVGAAWSKWLPYAFSLPPYQNDAVKRPWKPETEPFSGRSYLWTYSISGPGNRRYDLDWGNALPLYGLYKYAQYTGDWDFVRRHWSDVRRIYRYFDLGDDWAWMTVVNTDSGYSTGTGDPLCATYAGALAGLQMARALGDRNEEAHFAARLARVAIPTLSRLWLTGWARTRHLIGPRSVVLGFWEKETFTTGILGTQDPWDATNLLSGDGVLPELFNLYATYGRQALRSYEDDFAAGFPEWFRPDVVYPFETTYHGNSVYVTFPHIYARWRLGESLTDLRRYSGSALGNRNNAWIGPNVLAALASASTPFRLTEWQPARYVDGTLSQDGRTVLLHFVLPTRRTSWSVTACLNGPVRVRQVDMNGRTIPFTVIGQTLRFAHRASGSIIVRIKMGPTARNRLSGAGSREGVR